MAFELLPQSSASRTVCEWNMIISDVVEEVDLILFEHQGCSNRMDWSVTPALIEESAGAVQ